MMDTPDIVFVHFQGTFRFIMTQVTFIDRI